MTGQEFSQSKLNGGTSATYEFEGQKKRAVRQWVRRFGAAALLAALAAPFCWASNDPFPAPKPEELSMTSVPGYPGVAAVVLYKERIDSTPLRSMTIYQRIKVLNDDGKKYSNVVLAYLSASLFSGGSSYDTNIKDVSARTIHADGTIVPFVGKPYERTVEKVKGEKVKEKIITLSDVQVGSVLEYRYTIEYQFGMVPDWILQEDLPVKSAHYRWIEGGTSARATTWLPLLPSGVSLVKSQGNTQFDLNLTDLPPLPTDDFLPPSSSYVYRVMFNQIYETTAEEFWKVNISAWAKDLNDFLHINGDIKNKVAELTAGSKTQEESLRKIYAFVMSLKNLDYTRDYDAKEDKAQGRREVRTVSDILSNKQGNGYALTALFLAMARAAGMKAYGVVVPNRADDIYIPAWLTMRQFDALIALVTVDGKDAYFDPGSADCPYGQLPWQYTMVTGLRQTDSGGTQTSTPSVLYKNNREDRVADLTMDPSGEVEGSLKVTYSGSPALAWRHIAREGDTESFHKDLKDSMEQSLPKAFEATVEDVKQLADYESPLIVTFHIQGPLAAKAGKRLLVPADLLVSSETAMFSNAKRELQVYFHYPEMVADAVRVKFPSGLAVESVPDNAVLKYETTAGYSMATTATASSFTTQRQHATGLAIVPSEKYAALRDFYQKYETNDQQSVVLKPAQ